MGWFDHDDAARHHENLYTHEGPAQFEHHQAKFSHEAIAGAAGFEAMKAYEDHLKREGKPVGHAMMKELLAGFAAAEIDKLAETKGLDWVEKEKLKHHAREQAHHLAEQRYGQGECGWDYCQQNGYSYNYGYPNQVNNYYMNQPGGYTPGYVPGYAQPGYGPGPGYGNNFNQFGGGY